jgi:hypothetical protein
VGVEDEDEDEEEEEVAGDAAGMVDDVRGDKCDRACIRGAGERGTVVLSIGAGSSVAASGVVRAGGVEVKGDRT